MVIPRDSVHKKFACTNAKGMGEDYQARLCLSGYEIGEQVNCKNITIAWPLRTGKSTKPLSRQKTALQVQELVMLGNVRTQPARCF